MRKWTKELCEVEARKYTSRSEFRKNSNKAYLAAIRNGYINSFGWLAVWKANKKNYWNNYNNVLAIAKECHSRSEMAVKSFSAYRSAIRNGWLERFTWFEKTNKAMNYWTHENVIEIARQYSSRTEFRNGNCYAYDVARKNGWLDEIDWKEGNKPKSYWTEDKCKEEAMKYSSLRDFQNGSFSAYKIAEENGWIYSYEWMSPSKRLPISYWTFEKCEEAAKTCDSKTDFAHKFYSAYMSSLSNKWINKLFPSRKHKITKEYVLSLVKGMNNASEFIDKYPSIYNVAVRKGWLNGVFERKRKWTKENVFELAKQCKDKKEFRLKHPGAYNAANYNGWMIELFPKK